MASGNLCAQIIGWIFAPLLAFLYQPESLGLFYLFTAVVTTLTPLATAKYETAIIISKSNEEAQKLIFLCILLSFLSSSLFIGFLYILKPIIYKDYAYAISIHLFFLTVWFAIFLVSINTTLKNYFNYLLEYRIITNALIIQTTIFNTFSIGCFYFITNELSLILSFICSLIFSLFYLIKSLRKKSNLQLYTSKNEIQKVAQKYIEFPKYNASTSYLDGLLTNLPLFFISQQYSMSLVGQYGLTSKLLLTPIGFVANALSDINIKRFSDILNNNPSTLLVFFRKIFKNYLFFVSTLISLSGIALFLLKDIFFKEKWSEIPLIFLILSVGYIIKTVASSLSSIFTVTNNQNFIAKWRIVSFLFTLLVLIMLQFCKNWWTFLIYLTLSEVIIYSALLYYELKLAKKYDSKK